MTRLGMTVMALSLLPAVLAAQKDSSRMRGADSTQRAIHRQTSSGAIGRNTRLSHDQVTQVQTALQQANCDPGAIDGVIGSHTRSAMSCYRRNNNISGSNASDVYRALNLNFSTSDSVSGRNNRSRLNPGTPPNTNATHRPTARRDTTRPPTRPDKTRP